MDAAAVTELVSGAIGALAAIFGGYLSFRLIARENHKEQLSAEVAALRAADMEIAVAMKIATARSATDLPNQMLMAALPSIHHMNSDQRAQLVEYSQSVMRYNGRVNRLISYGEGKRAGGKEPGAEKMGEEHWAPVLSAGPRASQAISAHLQSSRYPVQERSQGAVT